KGNRDRGGVDVERELVCAHDLDDSGRAGILTVENSSCRSAETHFVRGIVAIKDTDVAFHVVRIDEQTRVCSNRIGQNYSTSYLFDYRLKRAGRENVVGIRIIGEEAVASGDYWRGGHSQSTRHILAVTDRDLEAVIALDAHGVEARGRELYVGLGYQRVVINGIATAVVRIPLSDASRQTRNRRIRMAIGCGEGTSVVGPIRRIFKRSSIRRPIVDHTGFVVVAVIGEGTGISHVRAPQPREEHIGLIGIVGAPKVVG